MHELKLRQAARSLSTTAFAPNTDIELLRSEAFRIASEEGVHCEVDDHRRTVKFTRSNSRSSYHR